LYSDETTCPMMIIIIIIIFLIAAAAAPICDHLQTACMYVFMLHVGSDASIISYGGSRAGKSFTMSGFGQHVGVFYRSILKVIIIRPEYML